MARERHPRARQAAKLARKQGTRPPYNRILIVCEGEKTERLYLDEIKRQLRLPTAHVKVMQSSNGTAPLQVVDCAEDVFRKDPDYECVIAVFDRDEHLTYNRALEKAITLDRTLRNADRKLVDFKAAVSVPCFEVWLLLHFQDVHAFGHRSDIINCVAGAACLPGYHKGSPDIYARTKDRIPQAIDRAQNLRVRFDRATGNEPYTDMDWLVSKLKAMAKP